MITSIWSFAVRMTCGKIMKKCTFLDILHLVFVCDWSLLDTLFIYKGSFWHFIYLFEDPFSSRELLYRLYCSIFSCTCDLFIFSWKSSCRLIFITLCILSCDLQRLLLLRRTKNVGKCIHPHFRSIENLLRIFTSVYKML